MIIFLGRAKGLHDPIVEDKYKEFSKRVLYFKWRNKPKYLNISFP